VRTIDTPGVCARFGGAVVLIVQLHSIWLRNEVMFCIRREVPDRGYVSLHLRFKTYKGARGSLVCILDRFAAPFGWCNIMFSFIASLIFSLYRIAFEFR